MRQAGTVKDVTTAPVADERALEDVLTAAETISRDLHEAQRELAALRSIATWALARQPLHVGDPVVITEAFPGVRPGQSGWMPYRHCLVPGATGVITEVGYTAPLDSWNAYVRMDVTWQTRDDGRVRAPEEPVTFCLPLDQLRLRTSTDADLVVPLEQG